MLVRKKGKARGTIGGMGRRIANAHHGRNCWSTLFEENWLVAGGGEGDGEKKEKKREEWGRRRMCDEF